MRVGGPIFAVLARLLVPRHGLAGALARAGHLPRGLRRRLRRTRRIDVTVVRRLLAPSPPLTGLPEAPRRADRTFDATTTRTRLATISPARPDGPGVPAAGLPLPRADLYRYRQPSFGATIPFVRRSSNDGGNHDQQ
jgi:hypothetical protein